MSIFILIASLVLPVPSYGQELKLACEVRETKEAPADCKVSASRTRFEVKLDGRGEGSKKIDSSFDRDYSFGASVSVFSGSEKYLLVRALYRHSSPASPQNSEQIQYVSREITAGRERAKLYDTVIVTYSDSKYAGPNDCGWKTSLMVCILAKAGDPWEALSTKVEGGIAVEAEARIRRGEK
jgi:hypothetical protein